MEIFLNMIEVIGDAVPAWVPLIFLPCLLALVAVVLTLFGGRKLYRYFAVIFGALGFFLITCIDGTKSAVVYLGLYFALAFALRLLFFIPCPLTFHRTRNKRGAREEKIYRKFRQTLSAQSMSEGEPLMALPMAANYEQPRVTAEECGMRLDHVTELLEQLKKEDLSPTDRLETDALSRSLDACRNKSLTEEEMCMLNDCLAAVLKLTAKYKL